MKDRLRIGFALTGSFCTFGKVMPVIGALAACGCEITPILSFNAALLDTRFGDAAMWREKLVELTGREPIDTITAAEPIGPKKLFDVLVVAPCTGNTLAKLAHGITDTPVTMAVKSHLRGEKPVVIAVSTNDGRPAAPQTSARCWDAGTFTLSRCGRMPLSPNPARWWPTWSVSPKPSAPLWRAGSSSPSCWRRATAENKENPQSR